jgi:hypothetical protein
MHQAAVKFKTTRPPTWQQHQFASIVALVHRYGHRHVVGIEHRSGEGVI